MTTLDNRSDHVVPAPPHPVEEMRWVVNPALDIVRSSDDEVVVRFGSRSTLSRRIRDEQRSGVLGDLVLALAEPCTEAELGAMFVVGDDTLAALVTGLREQRVVIPAEDTVYSHLLVGGGVRDADRLRQASIGVAGDGRLHGRVVAQLEDAGVSVSSGQAGDPQLFEEHDVVLVCTDQPAPGLLHDANEVALTSGRAWQPTYVDGAELVVGPLFVPGSTGCFHDFEALDEAARSLRIDYLFHKSRRIQRPRPVPLFVTDLAASYATSSVLAHLGGAGSFLEGFVLRVDLERMEVMREQLLQMPRCPACIQRRPHLRHPFL